MSLALVFFLILSSHPLTRTDREKKKKERNPEQHNSNLLCLKTTKILAPDWTDDRTFIFHWVARCQPLAVVFGAKLHLWASLKLHWWLNWDFEKTRFVQFLQICPQSRSGRPTLYNLVSDLLSFSEWVDSLANNECVWCMERLRCKASVP